MSHDDSQMTAAPRPLRFADGTEYRCAPLRDVDFLELDHWIRGLYDRTVVESMPEGSTADQLFAARCEASQRALHLTWTSGVGAAQLRTVDGIARLIWQACHRQHEGLTVADIRQHLVTPSAIREAGRTLLESNLPPELLKEGDGATPANPPTGPSRQKEARFGGPASDGPLSKREKRMLQRLLARSQGHKSTDG